MANKDKKVTNEELARMIAKGFAGTASKADFAHTATKEDLKPIQDTLKRTTALLAKVSEDTEDIKLTVSTVREVQDMHTTALDEIRKNTETSKAETAALRAAVKRHE